MLCDRSKLVEFSGHVELGRHWAYVAYWIEGNKRQQYLRAIIQ